MDDWLQHHHVARVRRQLDLSVAGLRILRQVISVGGLPGINSHGHERSVVPALFWMRRRVSAPLFSSGASPLFSSLGPENSDQLPRDSR
jgi:hypothetical protein